MDALDSEILGNWIFEDVKSDDKTVFEKVYLTIEKENGLYNVNAYELEHANGKYTGTAGSFNSNLEINHVDGFANISECTNTDSELNLEHVYLFDDGDDFYFVTSVKKENSKKTLASGRKVAVSAGDVVVGRLGAKATIADGVGSGDVTSMSIIAVGERNDHEHNFKLMTGNGSVVTNGHYVECECGLKYVLVAHGSGCDKCGYEDTWGQVTISTSKDVFRIPMEKGISLGTTGTRTYTTFLGEEIEYTGVDASNENKTTSRNGVYYCNEAKTAMNLALSK